MQNPPINLLKRLGNITTSFGGRTRGDPNHQGVDIANKNGTIIPAMEDGVIQATGSKTDGAGNVAILRDKNGNTHQYSHLKNALVKPGTRVKKGTPIAQMGSSGNSYSPSGGDATHLDLRISNAYGRYINPLTYLNGK